MGKVIGGAAQIAGSLIGGRQRRRDEKDARQAFNQSDSDLANFQFQNYNKDLENVYEDQTINQQATNVQSQQTDAGLAQGLDAIVAGGGGGGSAQAIANAALQSKQGISADIAGQEQQNQASRLDAQSSIDQAVVDKEDENQVRRFGQTQQQFGLNQSKLEQASAARDQATQQLVGGIGSVAGGVASAATGGIGGFASKLLGG